jgi:hypothetical protein
LKGTNTSSSTPVRGRFHPSVKLPLWQLHDTINLSHVSLFFYETESSTQPADHVELKLLLSLWIDIFKIRILKYNYKVEDIIYL